MKEGKSRCWPHIALEILGTEWFRDKIDREWVKKNFYRKTRIWKIGRFSHAFRFDCTTPMYHIAKCLLRFLE